MAIYFSRNMYLLFLLITVVSFDIFTLFSEERIMGICFSRNFCLLKLLNVVFDWLDVVWMLFGCCFMLMKLQPAAGCYGALCTNECCWLRHVALTTNPTLPLSWPSCSASLRERRGSNETMTTRRKFRREDLNQEGRIFRTNFRIHFTFTWRHVHRNKFLYNKNNQMH
jgi:hypothetical protein